MPSSIPLPGLRDIHPPDPISWWPPAPGWWLVATILILIWAVTLRFFLCWIRKKKLYRAALLELNILEAGYKAHKDAHYLAAEISSLLRRVCLSPSFPRTQSKQSNNLQDNNSKLFSARSWLAFLMRIHNTGGKDGVGVAGLTDKAWLEFLERDMPERPFSKGPGRILRHAPFQCEAGETSHAEEKMAALLDLCRTWLHTSL